MATPTKKCPRYGYVLITFDCNECAEKDCKERSSNG
jgi:hypothetical protein